MNKIPKNQQELLHLLQEQDKQIASMRQAIIILERRLNQTYKMVETTRHATKKQAFQTNAILTHLKESGFRHG